jgi:hypothetical protein
MPRSPEDILTDRELLFQQKYIHQVQTIETLTLLNTILTYAYFISIIFVLYYLFTKYDLSIYVKIGLGLFIIAYPFVIHLIEIAIYNTSVYIGAFITGTPVDRDIDAEEEHKARLDKEFLERVEWTRLNGPE